MGPIFQKTTSFLIKTNMQLLKFTATLPQNGPSTVTASFLTPQENTTTAQTPRANKLRYTTTLTEEKTLSRAKYQGLVSSVYRSNRQKMNQHFNMEKHGKQKEKIPVTRSPCPCFGQDLGNCSQSSRLQRQDMYKTNNIKEVQENRKISFQFFIYNTGG